MLSSSRENHYVGGGIKQEALASCFWSRKNDDFSIRLMIFAKTYRECLLISIPMHEEEEEKLAINMSEILFSMLAMPWQ